jgi:hypothetical protein
MKDSPVEVATDSEKTFPIGAEIDFTSHGLNEICFTYIGQANELEMSIIEFARAKGVEDAPHKQPRKPLETFQGGENTRNGG